MPRLLNAVCSVTCGTCSVIVLAWLLAACKPVTAPGVAPLSVRPTIAVSSADSDAAAPAAAEEVGWEQYRGEACRSFMDPDYGRMYERFDAPILWTFHINFFDPKLDNDATRRLGCLQYYWRDEANKRFTGTTDGGALVVPCEAVNEVTVEPFTEEMVSSREQRSINRGAASDLPDWKAHFGEGAEVNCNIDINAALQELSQQKRFVDEVQSLLNYTDAQKVIDYVPIMISQPYTSYPEFSAAAAIASLRDGEWPYGQFFSYQYPPAYTSGSSTVIHGLEPVAAGEASTFAQYAILNGGSFTGDQLAEKCLAPAFGESGGYFWLEYGQCENASNDECDDNVPSDSYLQFAYRVPAVDGQAEACWRHDVIRVDGGIPDIVEYDFYTESLSALLDAQFAADAELGATVALSETLSDTLRDALQRATTYYQFDVHAQLLGLTFEEPLLELVKKGNAWALEKEHVRILLEKRGDWLHIRPDFVLDDSMASTLDCMAGDGSSCDSGETQLLAEALQATHLNLGEEMVIDKVGDEKIWTIRAGDKAYLVEPDNDNSGYLHVRPYSFPRSVDFYQGPATFKFSFPGDVYEIWVDPDSAVRSNAEH